MKNDDKTEEDELTTMIKTATAMTKTKTGHEDVDGDDMMVQTKTR